MKKLIVGLVLMAILLCSCYQDEIYPMAGNSAYISIENNSETVVYWQLKKAGEDSSVYNRIDVGGYRTIKAEQGDAFVLSFAGLSDDTSEIVGETLVFKQTTTAIQTEDITLDDVRKSVLFSGDSSEIVCTIL